MGWKKKVENGEERSEKRGRGVKWRENRKGWDSCEKIGKRMWNMGKLEKKIGKEKMIREIERVGRAN